MLTPLLISLATVSLALAVDAVDPPAAPGALAPNLVDTGDGIYLTWLEPAETGDGSPARARRLRLSRFSGGAWSAASTIVERDDFFANWADVPSLAVAGDGTWYAHWLQRSGPGTYAYDAVVARSPDAGRSWTVLGPLHDDGTQTEHGFCAMVPEAGGVRAFWLDGRQMAGGPDPATGEHGTMTLRTALVTETIGESTLLDDRVCECCNTSAVVTPSGAIIAYRDRSDEEIRDVSIVRRTATGWSAPASVHADDWLHIGCPVNGPALDAQGALVVAAWYTGAPKRGAVRAAFSRDGGASFSGPLEVDGSWPLGRVDVTLVGPEEAVVCWLDSEEQGGSIVLRRLRADGALGEPLTAAATGRGRATGFPRIARLGDTLLVVWTQEARRSRLRAVLVPLREVPAVGR